MEILVSEIKAGQTIMWGSSRVEVVETSSVDLGRGANVTVMKNDGRFVTIPMNEQGKRKLLSEVTPDGEIIIY